MRVIPKVEDEGPALTRFKTKFTLPTRPSDSPPDLPNDLDDMDDRDLMNVYTEFMAWVSYLKGQLVQAEIEEEIIPIDEPIQNYKEQFNNNNDNGFKKLQHRGLALTAGLIF